MPQKAGASKAKVAKKKVNATKKSNNSKRPKEEHVRLFDEMLAEEEIDIIKTTIEKFNKANQMELERTDQIHEKLVSDHRKRLRTANLGEGCCAHCGKLYFPIFNEKHVCTICKRNIDKACLAFSYNGVELCTICRQNTIAKASTGSWFVDFIRKAKAVGRFPETQPIKALSSSLERICREANKTQSEDEEDDVDGDFDFSQGTNVESPMKRIGVAKVNPDDIASTIKSERSISKVSEYQTSIYKEKALDNEDSQSMINRKPYKKNPRATMSEFGTKSLFSLPGSQMSRVSSMTSIISDLDITGRILVSIDYIHSKRKLKIFINRAEGLAMIPERRSSSRFLNNITEQDPERKEPSTYIKVYLMPDRTNTGKRKTKVQKKSCNPKYMEELSYQLSEGEIRTRTINCSVWHDQSFGHNKFLGEFNLELDQHKFDPEPVWYDLVSREVLDYNIDDHLNLGEVTMAIKFEIQKTSPTGELHAWIKSGRNLASFLNSKKINESMSPMAKIYLIERDGKKAKKQKTKICPKTTNPVWNNAFIFPDIPRAELQSLGLQVEIWNGEKHGVENCIGMFRLNIGGLSSKWLDATENEQLIWKTIMVKTYVWAEANIPLRAYIE